jgi:hypothetical protein
MPADDVSVKTERKRNWAPVSMLAASTVGLGAVVTAGLFSVAGIWLACNEDYPGGAGSVCGTFDPRNHLAGAAAMILVPALVVTLVVGRVHGRAVLPTVGTVILSCIAVDSVLLAIATGNLTL